MTISPTPFAFPPPSLESHKRGRGKGSLRRLSLAIALASCFLLCTPDLSAQIWVQAAGIPAKPIIFVTEHWKDLYALSTDSVYRSLDSGETWFPTPLQPGHADNLITLYSHGEHIYLGTTNDGIYRSSDGGVRWDSFNEGYPGSMAVEFLSLGDSLYVGNGANGVYVRNMQLASSWTPYNDGLERFGVETIAASGDILVANIGLSTYLRRRGSPAWNEFLIDSAGGQLAVSRFYRFGDHLFAGVGSGVYRGTPEATGWQKVGINLLPNQAVEHLAEHGKRLLAGVPYRLEHFICYSDDDGATWGVLDHQLAELIAMRVVGNRIFAARADGLWYFDLGIPTGIGQPISGRADGFRLEQSFPNPFNPITTIKYTIGGVRDQGPGVSNTRLVVYDVLGREVATLVNEEKAPGSYHVTFDASGLASGVYYYTLTAGDLSRTRAMMLVK
jgi:hypothetical protein